MTKQYSVFVATCVALVLGRVPHANAQVVAPPTTQSPTQPPTLTIVEPTDGAYVAGPVTIVAKLGPEDLAVRRVEFHADGTLVCQVIEPPYVCAWDAGPEVKVHAIRVTASLVGSERLVQNLRTKALALTESSGVTSVIVPVVIQDGRGRFVPGLTREAFRVFEDDAPQTMSIFQAEDVPLDLAVLVDVSASMSNVLPRVQEAVRNLIRSLKPQDRLTLVGFNDRIYVVTKQEMNPAVRLAAVDQLTASGRTSFNDAIITAAGLIGGSISRRAILVFTDGDDTQSFAPIEAVRQRLRESDASVYIITHAEAADDKAVQKAMIGLTSATGGRAFALSDIRTLQRTFDEILEDLGHQYLLGYEPQDSTRDGRFRRIRVETSNKAYRVRAREGYRPAAP